MKRARKIIGVVVTVALLVGWVGSLRAAVINSWEPNIKVPFSCHSVQLKTATYTFTGQESATGKVGPAKEINTDYFSPNAPVNSSFFLLIYDVTAGSNKLQTFVPWIDTNSAGSINFPSLDWTNSGDAIYAAINSTGTGTEQCYAYGRGYGSRSSDYIISAGTSILDGTIQFSGKMITTPIGGAVYVTDEELVVKMTKPTCVLSQTHQDELLPSINVTQLANINQTAGEKDFNIVLTDCPSNQSISATFHDLNSGGDSQRGILGNTGTASAVKIQLLAKLQGQSSYQPLVLDSKTLLAHAPSDGGMVSLPFQARYFRLTNGQVSGTVNSLASFTLSYD